LLAPGCVNPFTGLESDVSIETTPDLALSLLKTNEDGFQYTACLSCSNGVETKTIDDFVMTQCKKLDGAIEDVALAFKEDAEPHEVTIDDTTFSNTESNCEIQTCTFHPAGDCGGESFLAPEYLILPTEAPWTVQAS
jgi:hypothetical protein